MTDRSLLPEDAQTGVVEDEGTGATSNREPSSWSSADPGAFYQARDYVYDTLTAAGWSVEKEQVTRALNRWAGSYYKEFGSLPSPGAVQDNPEPWVLAQRAALRSDLLPTAFVAEDADGNPIYYENRPELGPFPVAFPDIDPPTLVADQNEITADESAALQRDAQSGPTSPDFIRSPVTGRTAARPTGVMTQDYVQSILNMAAINQTRSGSGRGDITFDRAELEEYTRGLWRRWLREEPPNAGTLVSDYISDASSFWRSDGGKLDYDTWLKNQIRQTGKYEVFYSNMDESQSEEEYLEGFLTAEQFGLDPRIANQHITRGLTSGAAPAAFQESVARSRDVQALGQGSFSRRFASMLAQLGPLQKA